MYDVIKQSIGWENKEAAWLKYEEKITAVLSHYKIKPILPKLLIKFIDVIRKDYDEKCNDIIVNMMDRIFMEVNPVVLKENWVLAIKINGNNDLFKIYPKNAFKDNPMEGIQDKLIQSLRELKGKTETSGEKLAFSTLEKII